MKEKCAAKGVVPNVYYFRMPLLLARFGLKEFTLTKACHDLLPLQ